MNETITTMSRNVDLKARSEEELQTIIDTAKSEIERRKLEQEKRDIEQIRNIAQKNGWSVNVTAQGLRISFTKKARRGRPSKKSTNTSG